jgi:hypothetical protein
VRTPRSRGSRAFGSADSPQKVELGRSCGFDSVGGGDRRFEDVIAALPAAAPRGPPRISTRLGILFA